MKGVTTSTSGNTFGAYGESASPIGFGVVGNNTAASGSARGVIGESASPTGIGVEGSNAVETGGTIGVYGLVSSDAGYGVEGDAINPSGATIGVYGTTLSNAGYGVEGYADSTSGTTIGVYGLDSSTTGYGVEGQASAATCEAVGVYGKSLSTSGVGVEGNATADSGFTVGVNGTAASNTGVGVEGYVSAASGDTMGVLGRSASSSGVGVLGYGLTLSTIGTDMAGTNAGVWGDTINGEAAVFATAGDAYAFKGYNNSGSEGTLYVENQTTEPTAVVLSTEGLGGSCDIFTNGNLDCTGSVGGGVMLGADGSREVSMYAMQAPENWFEDAGAGQLHNGAAVVSLDAEYAQTVNAGVDYHVFLTPKGDCKGLYVSNETEASFEVHELGGGNSSIAFDYRIMAKRKGFENVRMADITGKTQRGRSLKSAKAGARNAAPQPNAVKGLAAACEAEQWGRPPGLSAWACGPRIPMKTVQVLWRAGFRPACWVYDCAAGLETRCRSGRLPHRHIDNLVEDK